MAEVVARGLRFHVQRPGVDRPRPAAARTAVFVHGLVMDNLSSWYFTVANPLTAVADVVLYDLRGHGRSDRPPSGYRVRDMVDDLAAVLDELGVSGRSVELVGNSFGGLLAIAFALAYPERVSGLALVDANMSDERWGIDVEAGFAAEGAERDRLIARYAYRWAGRHSERKTTRLAEAAKELVYGTTLVRDLASSPVLTDERLASIACPVLALYGDGSELLDRGERLSRLVPDCELRLFPGCTHLLLWEATEELKEVLAGWLTRPERAGVRAAGR